MFSSWKTVKKTRKPHICSFCERRIDIGERAGSGFYVDGGAAHSNYMCAWCFDNHNLVLDGESEYEVGMLWESVCNHIENKCSQCNGRDLDITVDTRENLVIVKCNWDACAHRWSLDLKGVFEDYQMWKQARLN